VAPLAALIHRADVTRCEAMRAREETHRLSNEARFMAQEITERCRVARETLVRSETIRRELPRWPAWAPPDVEELRFTLVPIE